MSQDSADNGIMQDAAVLSISNQVMHGETFPDMPQDYRDALCIMLHSYHASVLIGHARCFKSTMRAALEAFGWAHGLPTPITNQPVDNDQEYGAE